MSAPVHGAATSSPVHGAATSSPVRGAATSSPVRGSAATSGPVRAGARVRQRGYTLLEVMLAFVVLALGLSLLIGILTGGLRQIRWSEQVTEATLYAQSVLDPIGATERPQPGRREGEFEDGRYRWTLDIDEIDDPAPLADRDRDDAVAAQQPQSLAPTAQLYRVALEMHWGNGDAAHSTRFVTLRALQPEAGDATGLGGADGAAGASGDGSASNRPAADRGRASPTPATRRPSLQDPKR